MLAVGLPSGTAATPLDSAKYALDYWTANADVYTYEAGQLTAVVAGTHLTSPANYYVSGEVSFTAHFKQIAGDVSYTSVSHGSVSPSSEKVAFSEKTIDGAGTHAMAGTPEGSTVSPDADYEFDYWTANVDVIVASDFSTIAAGGKITNDQLRGILITGDTTFTAHFKHLPVSVTYASDEHGTVGTASESVAIDKEYTSGEGMLAVGLPSGTAATPTDSAKYALDYWTANADVYTYESGQLTAVVAGTHLTSPANYYVSGEVSFTAHFKQISSEADSSNDTDNTGVPSGSSGSNSTGNSGGNPTPATGDTLLGTAVVIFLCTGVATALAALFRRRNY